MCDIVECMDKEILKKHIENRFSSRKIAELENTSQTNVRYWLKKYDLQLSYKRRKFATKQEAKEEAAKRNRRTSREAYYSDNNIINCWICEKPIRKRTTKTTRQACLKCYRSNTELFH
jgi:hypothetical protein